MSAPASYGMPPPGIVPALSLRSPWGDAIVRLGKRVENRLSWTSCAYRGPLILHSAKYPTGDPDKLFVRPSTDFVDFLATCTVMVHAFEASGFRYDQPITARDILTRRGGVIGRAELVDVISGPLEFEEAIRSGRISLDQRPWYMGGFALILANVEPLPFIPCGGALGLFGLHPDVYRQVMARPMARRSA